MLLIKLKLLIICLLICFPLFSQFSVRFNVYDPTKREEIYIAGTFNNWNAGDKNYKLVTLDAAHKYIVIKNIPAGKYFFKFTRGSWGTVETKSDGTGIDNREIVIRNDTSIQIKIAGWFDAISGIPDVVSSTKFTVRFNIYDPAKKNATFLAGSFNDFKPGDDQYKLIPIDSTHKYIILKNIPSGKYFYKFTRGNWGTVESTVKGDDIDDRIIEIRRDTSVQINIAGWIDDYVDLNKFPDSTRLTVALLRSRFYQDRNLDSSYKYAKYGFDLAEKNGDKQSETFSLIVLGEVFIQQGNSAKALELFLQALSIAQTRNDSFHLVMTNQNIGNIFESEGDYTQAKNYYKDAIKYTASATDIRGFWRSQIFLSLGKIYFNSSKLDSATYYADLSNALQPSPGAFLLQGDIEKKSGSKLTALDYYKHAIAYESLSDRSSITMAEAYQRLAQSFIENNQIDSGFFYAKQSFDIANNVKNPFIITDASALLSKLFEKEKKFDSAFFYQQIVISTKDSLFTREKEKQIHNLVFNEQLHKKEIEVQKDKFRSKAWIYSLAAGLLILLLVAAILIHNNRQKKNANKVLQNTLSELKSTQAQLIQSEKMASLGELTAGIAHEIQNPLNFVNNFSEVNNELIEELKAESETLNTEQQELMNDIYSNNEKIAMHGKRADAIVKGMLQHSRQTAGTKEATDINVLCDEYLRLSYHGLRAKDKSFKADIKTEFDESIGKINIVPQDTGRVLLNLFNNAFYATNEKQKAESLKHNADYKPLITVKTKKINDKIEIRVEDNGNGIPQNIIDKIFQPFFTTKPTGEGTGLGLSLAYDIITKEHNGRIKVESKEGEGSKFIITLPVSEQHV